MGHPIEEIRTQKQENPLSARFLPGDRTAWVVFCFGLLLLFGGGYYALHRQVIVPPAPPQEATDNKPRMTILSYPKLVNHPDGIHIDQARLREHLHSLKKEGFVPITLGQVQAFYDRGIALPPRPLLLTFDSGYLETYKVADPLLREMKWTAVIFINTIRQNQHDVHFLYWDRLQRMVDSGVWEVGVEGVPDTDSTPVRETLGQKIFNHANTSKRFIETYFPAVKKVGFAFLPGTLEAISNEQEIAPYLKELKTLYPVCFRIDHFGINDRHSNAHCLKRFQVTNRWTGTELAQRLQSVLTDPPFEERATDRNDAGSESNRLVGTPKNPAMIENPDRADIWMPGSPWAMDWVIEGNFRVSNGTFGVVQKLDTIGEAWEWRGDEKGMAIRYKGAGETFKAIALSSLNLDREKWHHLRIVKRGAGVWVEWNGTPLWERPVYLPRPQRGPVGLVVSNPGGAATLHYANLMFSQYPYRSRLVSAWPDQTEVQSLVREASNLSAISPPGVIAHGDRMERLPVDQTLFNILARRFGWEIIPSIRVLEDDAQWLVSESDLDQSVPSQPVSSGKFLALIQNEGWAGVQFDLTALSPRSLRLWRVPLKEMQQTLETQGKRFMITPADATRIVQGES